MSQKDYADILCQSIDEIVTKRIEGIQFDKTINCTIIDVEKAKEGQYKVTDGSSKFYAYSVSTDYKKDDAVYVTIPNGDFNNQKIIIGKQVTNNTSPFLFTTPFDTIVDVSTNLINDKITEGHLRANDPSITKVLLWEKNFIENRQDIAGFTRLGLQGQFRSWLDSFKCIEGEYGYKLFLYCKEEVLKTEENNYDMAITEAKKYNTITEELKQYITYSANINLDWDSIPVYGELIKRLEEGRKNLSYKKYELTLSSTNDMYGNPYNFDSYYQQEKVFDISEIKQIEKMELYFYQVPTSFINKDKQKVPYLDDFGNPLLPNLFTKDAYICLGYDVATFNEDQANIYCLDSNTYSDHYLLEDNSKQIILRWVHKFDDGRIKTVPDSSDLDYEIRWYRYKLGAPSADEYSGIYWERVNDRIEVKESLDEIKAINSYYTFYTNNRQNQYVQNFPYGEGSSIISAENYAGDWPEEVLNKYNISPELAKKAFFKKRGYQDVQSLEINISQKQNWLELYENDFVFHDKTLESYSSFPREIIDKNGVPQEIYGCLHYYGFWEKLTLAYKIYWLEPDSFDKLGDFSLLKYGGKYSNDNTWDNVCSGKNIYSDISYKLNKEAVYEILPNNSGTSFRKTGSPPTGPWTRLFDAFTQSFGAWKMTENDEFGMKNYIPENEEVYNELDLMLYNFFSKLNDPTYEIKITKSFYYNLKPDIKKEQEQIKAIILFNNKVIRSNILTFTNEKEVINEATSQFLQGLNIWCKDNTYGNYYIYDPGNKMLEEYDVKQARELVALFSTKAGLTTSEQESSILTEATSITWTFPTVNTMLEVYDIDYSVPYPNKDASQFTVCAPRGMTAAQGYATFKDGGLHTLKYQLNDKDKTEIVYDHLARVIMITRYGDINNAEAINPYQLYFIKKDYIQSYANNVIQCSIVKNHTDYFTSKTFYFGQSGTTGTDVTLKIYIDPADTFALTKDADGDTIHCKALLFDSHNKEIDPNNTTEYANIKYEWSWFDYKYDDETEKYIAVEIQPYVGSINDTVNSDSANQIIKNKKWFTNDQGEIVLQDFTTYYSNSCRNEIVISANEKLNMNHFLILQCTVKGWGDYDLITYKPIAIRLGETYSYADTANEVIYLTSGYPKYYTGKWKIHLQDIDNNQDGYEDEYTEGQWKIFNPYNENTNYIGSIKENALQPIGIYMDNVHQYGVQYYDKNNQIVWTQPVIFMSNNYPSGTLNKWPGKEIEINQENGYILAPAIAAGKKNSDDNTFSGVMLGDWHGDPNGVNAFIGDQTGIYGFHHGMISYAFMENGTAFIGKAGKGRIYIDGDKSTIQSEGYNLGHGILIDLDDNLIEMKNGSGGIYLDASNDLKIDFSTKEGDSLFLLDTSTGKYYLQSEDYVKGEAGILIDLAENRIYAYNFILEASGEGGTLTLDSSHETHPFNVNDKFLIGWDGSVTATWGTVGGFIITDHSIFGSPFTKSTDFTAAEAINIFGAKTYWGETSHGAGTYDFRLGNTLIYRGDQNGVNSRGRLYLASNLYSFRGGDADITSADGLKTDAYFIYGINKDDNLQVGSASSRSEYKDVNIYGGASSGEADGEEGTGAAIRLIPQGSQAADFSLKITKDKLIIKGIEPGSQKGIYARFG